MKKLTKEEVLTYLKKEGILYKVIEDENDKGTLEITGIELNTLSSMIHDLKEKQRNTSDLIKRLHELSRLLPKPFLLLFLNI